jgi:dTDP-4-amino-4,6-dideoxygalactose transaminase
MQAAVLSVKLPHLRAWTEARQTAAAIDDAFFAESNVVRRPFRDPEAKHVFHQYVVRVPADARDGLRDHLRARGVPTIVYYPEPLHLLEAYESYGFGPGDLPHTEAAAREVLALPMHPWLTLAQIRYVAEAVASFMGVAIPDEASVAS